MLYLMILILKGKKIDALYKLILKIILLTLHTGLSLLYTIMKKKDPNIHNKIFKMILDMDGRVSGQIEFDVFDLSIFVRIQRSICPVYIESTG